MTSLPTGRRISPTLPCPALCIYLQRWRNSILNAQTPKPQHRNTHISKYALVAKGEAHPYVPSSCNLQLHYPNMFPRLVLVPAFIHNLACGRGYLGWRARGLEIYTVRLDGFDMR